MLGRFEILVTFIGGGIAFLVALGIIKRTRSNILPSGSIVIDKIESKEGERGPGNRWSQLGVAVPPVINAGLEIFVIVLCFINFWEPAAQIIAFNLPIWVNWIGIGVEGAHPGRWKGFAAATIDGYWRKAACACREQAGALLCARTARGSRYS